MRILPILTFAELRKLVGRRLLWVEMGLLALLIVVLHITLMAVLQRPGEHGLPPQEVALLERGLRWPQGVTSGLAFINGGELGGLFAVVLVAAFMAQEYTWRTVHLWISRGIDRAVFLAAKMLAIMVALMALVWTAFFWGAAVTGVYTLHTTGELPWHQVAWAGLLGGVLKMILTLLPYAAFTLAVAVLSRSTMIATAVGLGYSLVLENLVVEVLLLVSPRAASLARYLPRLLAKSLAQTVTGSTEVHVGLATSAGRLLSPEVAAVFLVLYAGLGFLVAGWAFRRQDIPG